MDYSTMSEIELEQAKNALDAEQAALKLKKKETEDEDEKRELDTHIQEIRVVKLAIQAEQEKFAKPPVPGAYTIGLPGIDASVGGTNDG